LTDATSTGLPAKGRQPLSAGQPAALTGLTTGAITTVIDHLEDAGFAQRVKDSNDRRKVIIEPKR